MIAASSVGGRTFSFKLVAGLARPHSWRLTLGFSALLIGATIQLSYPKVIAYFLGLVETHRAPGWLSAAAAVAAGALVLQATMTMVRTYAFSSAGTMMAGSLKKLIFSAILGREIAFFDAHNVGELANRVTTDVDQFQDIIASGMAESIQVAVTLVGAGVMLVLISPELSAFVLLFGPPNFLAARWGGRWLRERARLGQTEFAKCGQIVNEAFSNIRLVHALEMKERECRKYDDALDSAQKLLLVSRMLFARMQGAGSLLQNAMILIILWIGGFLVRSQALSFGDLAGFVLYAGMAVSSATILSGKWNQWMRARGAADRVFELLKEAPAPRRMERGVDRKALIGSVTFDNVSFAYPSRPGRLALNGFNLNITSGETVALVGSSGAGKTTIVSLLLGFYAPERGVIRFDGLAAPDLDRAWIRRNIAVVEQEPVLFSGSIMDNIRYAAPDGCAAEHDIIEAAIGANAHEFISAFPLGYRTMVGHRGIQLSGGQKQRIAIARALLRDPRILILDEATSALDFENEEKVQSAICRLMAGRTTIIITHRESMLAYADRLIFMKDGCVVGSSNPSENVDDTATLANGDPRSRRESAISSSFISTPILTEMAVPPDS